MENDKNPSKNIPEIETGNRNDNLSETAREHGSGDQLDNKDKQKHENRQDPMKDHVPGHLGYNRHDHLEGVNPTSSSTEE